MTHFTDRPPRRHFTARTPHAHRVFDHFVNRRRLIFPEDFCGIPLICIVGYVFTVEETPILELESDRMTPLQLVTFVVRIVVVQVLGKVQTVHGVAQFLEARKHGANFRSRHFTFLETRNIQLIVNSIISIMHPTNTVLSNLRQDLSNFDNCKTFEDRVQQSITVFAKVLAGFETICDEYAHQPAALGRLMKTMGGRAREFYFQDNLCDQYELRELCLNVVQKIATRFPGSVQPIEGE
jgi:hypothetical protein